jgi:hypothetical protein
MKVVNPAIISVRRFVPRSENLKKPLNPHHPFIALLTICMSNIARGW